MPVRFDRLTYIFLILLYTTIAFAFEIGIGGGVASYPGSLDPYDVLDRVPTVYPRAEVVIPVAQKWQIRCCVYRSVYEVNLYGCFCLQSLTTNHLSLGGAYRLGKKGDVMIGVDGLCGFCVYDHGGVFVESNNYGVKIHVSAQQPLWRDLSYVLRAGVQQTRIVNKDDLLETDMTVFTVECLVVLGL